MHTRAQGQPTRTASLLNDVSKLHESNADETILSCKAIVFNTELELITVRVIFIAQVAEEKKINFELWIHVFQ